MLSAANTHDSMLFEPLLDTNPTVRGHHGRACRPRCRPDRLHADKGYDYRRCRRYLTRRGIKARIARRGIEGKSRLGRVRWGVERTTLALLTLACIIDGDERALSSGSDQPSVGPPLQRRSMRSACGPRSL